MQKIPDHQVEAKYYDIQPDCAVRCTLCPHHCRILMGQSGRCLGRTNENCRLVASSYGQITSIALDPIEKKPLNRFYPGSMILSAGSYGCNLSCDFCQNWTIAQRKAPAEIYSPQELVDLALREKPQGNIGIAFTYNEPIVTFEFVLDCCKLAHEHDLKTVLVTNGLINQAPLLELLPYVDAMNIDLKAFRPLFYHKYCHGELASVKQTIQTCVGICHVELTTLLIPGLNDDEGEMDELASWIATLDRLVPLHLTRHHPAFRMTDIEPISRDRMELLAKIARRHLSDVFLGNI